MSKKTWTPVPRPEYIRALRRTFAEIARKVDEHESMFSLSNKKVREEINRKVIEAAGDQKKIEDSRKEMVQAFVERGKTFWIEYSKALEQLRELGFRLAPPSDMKQVGIEGIYFQIRIGCMQAIAFLDDLLGGEEPRARML